MDRHEPGLQDRTHCDNDTEEAGVNYQDEYLEKLWVMAERGESGLAVLAETLCQELDKRHLEALVRGGLVACEPAGDQIALTVAGRQRAERIIRAHRIGERLLYDVFGGRNLEEGACEFEHIVTTELVDGLCTLLGHPRKCPHGNPIPEGECCHSFDRTARHAVSPLADLELGQRARVAYIDCRDNRRLHKLNGLQIRPGAEIVLRQRQPCLVVECEGTCIALDAAIAGGIRVWSGSSRGQGGRQPADGLAGTGRLGRLGRWLLRRRDT